ncbi:MAG: phosphoribosylformylglycinamidine synthase subunit PurS [Clostridia bacterium]|jgi:phosphoribosylformylglycinamidine synthase|nr:phosphoribosylformylglycinamidine synthase subunit PurS [Clostridia bacterium]MDH7573649.1 phosphoribosylformylglycinamidine synthase subunit PurS [Clostridia bacterium]
MYLVKVQIMLKPGVLDPQGNTVREALHSLNYSGVEEVRLGKYLEIRLAADGEEAAREQVEEMCRRLLANPVIEEYRLLEVSATGGR